MSLHSKFQDQTARAAQDSDVSNQQDFYRLFFDHAREAMLTLTPARWQFCSGNPAARALFALDSTAEFTALAFTDFVPPRQPDGAFSGPLVAEALERAVREGHYTTDWNLHALNGRTFPASVRLIRATVAGETLIHAFVRDLSATEQAEQARVERDLFSAGPVFIMVWDCAPNWPVRQASTNVSAILGYTPDEMTAPDFRFAELIHPDDLARVIQEVNHYIEQRTEHFEQSYRLKNRHGRYRWFYNFSQLRFGADGAAERIHGYLFDQSRLKEVETSLQDERQRLEDVLLGTRAGAWEWNIQTGAVAFNERWAEMIGYSLAELAPISIDTWLDHLHPDDLAISRERLDKHFRGELDDYDCDLRLRHKAGHWVWVQARGKVTTWSEDGKPLLMRGTHLDIHERKLGEDNLKLAASVFSHSREGIIITNARGAIIDVNEAFSRITGYTREEALGRNPSLLHSGRQNKAFYNAMWRSILTDGYWSGEMWNQRKNGEVFAERLTISMVRDDQGEVLHYVGLFSDITQIKEQQQQLERIAHYDALTNLPNRVLLADRLQAAMAHARRYQQRLAVVYLDLDGFKVVNDNHGHEVGDALLVVLAGRMKQVLRHDDILARLGGDEFVAVLTDLPDRSDDKSILRRLLAAVAEPAMIASVIHRVTVSLGVTVYPQHEEVDADQLLRQADQAMYQAKVAGKNRYHCFDAEHDRDTRGRHESLEHIRQALAEDQFVLYYQPKVNMRTGAVKGAEALIRWQHPEQGLLPPAAFLPVIEDHTLGVKVGEWVIDTALRQLDRWGQDGIDLTISVNIGARQLQQPDFVDHLASLLASYPGVKPSRLGLEVLETSAFEDLGCISRVIRDCRDLGVTIALDDFGTGYSSLTYLKRLPVNQLKIDQSFVRDMLEDPDDLAIVESVLGLTVAFRLQAIAEGVETREHGELLLELGCELGQGYGIARPMPADKIPDWLATWRPDPSWIGCPRQPRAALPLIHANAEQRGWVLAIERSLHAEQIPPLPLAADQCRFGDWIVSGGLGDQPQSRQAREVQDLHQQLHRLGLEIMELANLDQAPIARQRLDELRTLSATLSNAIRQLLRGGAI